MSNKMKLIATGTGAAFTMKNCRPDLYPNNWQTNYVVQIISEEDPAIKQNMLLDCGSDIRFALRDQGLSHLDIDAVYISHAHADHIGGLEFLAFVTYFDPRYKVRTGGNKPILFTEHQLMRDLWDHSLRGGLEGLEGVDATLDTYFETRPVQRNQNFRWGGITFDLVQSMHISAKYAIVNSFGTMFTDFNGKRIYITTDVQFAPETSMKAYYKEADIIIHDCETLYKSGVHAHYELLRTLPDETKKKMRLIHYQDNVLEDWDAWQERAKADGFYGFVKPGVIYHTDE